MNFLQGNLAKPVYSPTGDGFGQNKNFKNNESWATTHFEKST